MSEQVSSNIQNMRQELRPQSNYIRFADGEKKVLIFNGDPEHSYPQVDEKFGKRGRFIVTDVTDAMRPIEGRIWDVSPRWANRILDFLEKHEECLEIERQGTGTGTIYAIRAATPAE